jgi:hypothetical protein
MAQRTPQKNRASFMKPPDLPHILTRLSGAQKNTHPASTAFSALFSSFFPLFFSFSPVEALESQKLFIFFSAFSFYSLPTPSIPPKLRRKPSKGFDSNSKHRFSSTKDWSGA